MGEDDLVAEIRPDLTGSVGFTDAPVGTGMAGAASGSAYVFERYP